MSRFWSWLERHPIAERLLVLALFTAPLWLSMGLQLWRHLNT